MGISKTFSTPPSPPPSQETKKKKNLECIHLERFARTPLERFKHER